MADGHVRIVKTAHERWYDAAGAVTRLLNIGIEPYLVSASLVAVLAQRLVRKICTNCKEPFDPPVNVRRSVEWAVGEVETFYHGIGCAKCRKTGFSGRIGIYELLVATEQMQEKITQAPNIRELRALAADSGMRTLRQDGMGKVRAGITTVEEVFRVTAA